MAPTVFKKYAILTNSARIHIPQASAIIFYSAYIILAFLDIIIAGSQHDGF